MNAVAFPPVDAAALFAEAAARRDPSAAYAGAVTPPQAWALVTAGAARLVDVRTPAELQYVGRVPGALHVQWHGSELAQIGRFLQGLQAVAETGEPLLFLCRSGQRSQLAATVAADAGYAAVYNVLEGFEGRRNEQQQRGLIDGWRRHGLPWVQD